jgi:predicted AlkP superfamily phosphohydrolase/phosphomutase
MESTLKKRVVLIGLDGLMPEMVERYKDRIPELKQLLAESRFFPALSNFPTDTPTNWTTIATGAGTASHGITSFRVHRAGMELNETVPTFNSTLCTAEYLWQAAERQGKQSILINYPTAFPVSLQDGVVVGGDGLHSEQWTLRWPELLTTNRDIPDDVVLRLPGSKKIRMRRGCTWTNVPDAYEALWEGEVELDLQSKFTWTAAGIELLEAAADGVKETRYAAILRNDDGCRLVLSRSKDFSRRLTLLAAGEWSGWVREVFEEKECLRQYKLLELDGEEGNFTLYGSLGGSPDGWTYPAGLENSIIEAAGPYIEALELSPDGGLINNWFGEDTALEIMELQRDFIRECTRFLCAREPDWDLLLIQYHEPDGMNHLMLKDLEDPASEAGRRADAFLCEVMQCLYRMVADIAEICQDGSTYICVVSDHGNIPINYYTNLHGVFMRRGWEVFRADDDGTSWSLDTTASKAAAFPNHSGVWINLEGREKNGCVAPGREFEELRNEIIDCLRSLRNPATGEYAFELVASREALEPMGLNTERMPDIIAIGTPYYLFYGGNAASLTPEQYSFFRDSDDIVDFDAIKRVNLLHNIQAVHWHLPQAETPASSNRAVFSIAGPGIKAGWSKKNISLRDVAPSLAHLLDIEPPAGSEGRILWEALRQQENDT